MSFENLSLSEFTEVVKVNLQKQNIETNIQKNILDNISVYFNNANGVDKDMTTLNEAEYNKANADIEIKIAELKQKAQSIGDKKPIELGDEEKEGLSIEDNTMLPEHQKEANDIYTKIISKFHERGIDLKSNPKMESHIKNIAVSYVKNHHNPNTYNSNDKIDINGIYLIELKSGYNIGYDIVYPNPSDDRYPCIISRLRYDKNMNPLDTWGDPIE